MTEFIGCNPVQDVSMIKIDLHRGLDSVVQWIDWVLNVNYESVGKDIEGYLKLVAFLFVVNNKLYFV